MLDQAAAAGSPPPTNGERCGRCTAPAATPAAPSGSPTARSTTSSTGSANAAPPTSHNLLPLCTRHHHDVHEGGWHLTLHPDRTITLHRPDGTLHYEGSTIDVAPTGVADLDPNLVTRARQRIDALLEAVNAA